MVTTVPAVVPKARNRMRVEQQIDFTGGLNLQVDPFDLDDNESPLIFNCDIDRRGGFGLRRGRRLYIDTETPGAQVSSLIPYYKADGTNQLIVSDILGDLYTWNGSSWDTILDVADSSGVIHHATMGDRIYMSNGDATYDCQRWDGSTMHQLAIPGYNDDLTSPTASSSDGNFPPRAKALAVHAECMWAGNLFETLDLEQKTCRIRWSHPGFPEDWRTNDFIDIDPEDSKGQIRALVPFQERLLVFKDQAVYAVHGYPPNGFSVTNITREVGAFRSPGIAITENEVYFVDPRIGLCVYDGKEVRWLMEKVYPVIEDSQADPGRVRESALAHFNQRVWLSMPWLQEPFDNTFQTLVYDPYAGKHGAWVRYTANDSTVWTVFVETDGSKHLLGGEAAFVFETDVEGLYQDERAGSPTTREIPGVFLTRWFDANNPALHKRWKRPEVVLRDNANLELHVDVFADYDPTTVKRSFKLNTTQNADQLVWDVGNWDQNVWARESGDRATVLRGAPLGNGRAMALRFRNIDQTGIDWRVHGLVMKYIPKRIRN